MPSLGSRTTTFLLKRLVKSPSAQDKSVVSVRRAVNAFTQITPRQPGVKIWNSEARGLTGEWVVPPKADDGRLIFYIHGGGYFFGSPQTHRPMTTRLAKLSKSRLFALQYRLAPENKFPAPIEDSVGVYCELLGRGYDPKKIVVAGDSAGGGLTLATLVALKEQGIPMPAGAVCFSPWTDLAVTGESVAKNARICAMFREEGLVRAAEQYLADVDPRHPLASPLYADLSGLPPLLIHASDTELLMADSQRIAEKARAAGVLVELELFRDQPHVWQIFSLLPEAKDSLKKASEMIRCWVPDRNLSAAV